MDLLVPLPVAIPLIVAAVMVMFTSLVGRRLADAASILTAAATLGLCGTLLAHAGHSRTVYWFSGWRPHRGIALGISFTVDQFGAAMATMVAGLTLCAFVYSWHYFEETVEHGFNVLMLVFMAAMVGFSLTGDLFNLFVWFELMGTAAYALTGYKLEARSPLQGALNFGVSNSMGGYTILLGIALLYARTGALNLAQIGHAVEGRTPDGLLIGAFVLIVVGLFVKAAVVPFHFWLADAHAVAPTPVCVLFSGAMVELGLFGAARLYWTVFHGPFAARAPDLGHVMIGLGALTAVVGAVMCFAQQHLKRLLAFSTISHIGLFLVGFGLLDHVALAGSAVYVAAHGCVKASLFLCAGIVLHRLRSVDEEHVRGRGRALPWTGMLVALGALALAELPPFGTALGKTLIEDSASRAGYHWVPWLFGLTAALTGGAVLRAAGRVFLGLGPDEEDRFASDLFAEEEDQSETDEQRDRTPAVMIVPAIVLLAAGLAIGLVPHLADRAQTAAARFQDRGAYTATVLTGRSPPSPAPAPEGPGNLGVVYGALSGAGAVAVAALALFRRRLFPVAFRSRVRRVGGPALVGVRRLHSGHIGDYLAWLTLGLGAVGGLFTLALHR